MALFVMQSEKFSDKHFFIVDENNLNEKAIHDSMFRRIQEEEEIHTLEIFEKGGDERFEIIKGKPYDFFIALIRKTFG